MRMNTLTRLAVLVALALAITSHAFEIYGPFSNHMVLQRNQPITLKGRASPHTPVKLELGHYRDETVSRGDGTWELYIPSRPAETNLALTVFTPFQHLRFENIAFGDVFLCSGQSNMEWPLKYSEQGSQTLEGTPSRSIRIYRAPQAVKSQPQNQIPPSPWFMASRETIKNYGALPYYFAEAIQARVDIPIGLVLSSKKGTHIKSWTPLTEFEREPSLRKIVTRHGVFMDIHKKISDGHAGRFDEWLQTTHLDLPSTSTNLWAFPSFEDSAWETVQLPDLIETNDTHDGIFWFRKEFDLPPDWSDQNVHIHMGRIRNYDHCYINGELIGSTGIDTYSRTTRPRRYFIPASKMKPSGNLIAIRVFNAYGIGGFDPHPKNFYLKNEKEKVMSLAGEWRRHTEKEFPTSQAGNPPLAPAQNNLMIGPGELYNTMIYPLKNFPFKAILWYQGESDTKTPEEYGALFSAMIQGWRKTFNPETPFYYVQLAGFPYKGWEPEKEHWATFRTVQAEAAKQFDHCEMVTAIDLGHRGIHPLKKKPLAQRLANLTLNQLYGYDIAWRSPELESFTKQKSVIILTIKNAGTGLTVSDDQPIAGFSYTDSDDNVLPASAKLLDAHTLEVSIPARLRVVSLNYAQQNYPEGLNLYTKEGLPLLPFKVSLPQ